jgi:WD40 repeat protein
MVSSTASDVFLSYSRADAQTVEAVRARLSEAGITSFLDWTNLPGGQPWQPFLERELGRSSAVAVFVGRRMGSWQHREIQVALDRQSREGDFPVIPVLLPGLDDEPKGFLALQTWIDLRAGIDDPTQLQNLIAAIHREAPEGAAAIKAAICPYRGLLPFREEDAAFFFGRDDWIEDLSAKVQAHRLVAVVGRSGSGKSSLVFAGLFPALRKSPGGTTWDMLAFRPGHEPLNALAEALSPPPEGATPAERIEKINADADRLRRGTVRLEQLVRHHLDQQPGTDRLLLYIDQWEELYTLAARGEGASKTGPDAQTGSAGARHANPDVTRFIDLLLAAGERDSPISVVLTVRADFYDHLLRHPTLPAAIQGQQLNLGPMTRAQLQKCIAGPAAAVGLRFEGTLVESILDDVGEDEGKLPLLEYALRETWEASRKVWQSGGAPGLLTFAAYTGIGGVGGAIGTRAEQIYEKLDEAQQQAARRLFVSLVTPGEGREDTRTRAAVPDEPAMAEVVREFSDPAVRLLVTGWDQSRGERLAEVSHEALIRNWGTLRSWIAANREILRTRERIRAQMKHWEEEKRDSEYLLPTGRPLEEGRDLLRKHGDVLIDQETREYVQASDQRDNERKAQEQRHRDEEKERQVEAARAVAAANKRTARRTAVALAVALTFATLAGWQWYEATNQTTIAEQAAEYAEEAGLAAMAAKNDADTQRRAAVAEADKARAAERKALAQESRALAALAQSETRAGNAVNGMLLALRGMPVAEAAQPRPLISETRTALVDAALAQRELLVLRGHEQHVWAAAFSADGARIVSGSWDGTARVWDAASGTEQLVLRGHKGLVWAAGFSPDSARVVSGSEDRTVRVWDAASGAEQLVLRGHEEAVDAAAFSPDGARIVSGSGDKTVRVWDAASGAELLVLRGHERAVLAAGFSPDGARIVSGSWDGTVRVWDAASGAQQLVLRGHGDLVMAAGFSPDGARIVSGSWDGTVRVWDAASGAEQLVLRGHEDYVNAAGFSPDGARIVSGSSDDMLRVWDAASGAEQLVLRGHEDAVYAAGFSPDGARIVSGSWDDTLRVWDAASGAEQLVLRGHEGSVYAAGFSPDGARIVSGSWDRTLRVWDAASGAEQLVLRGHEDAVYAAGFSPDGARIVSGSWDRTLRVWDAASGAEQLVLRGHEDRVYAAGFSPDGARIVSGSEDKMVRVWFVGKDDADLVAHACAALPRDLSPEDFERFNLDPDAPWPCAERAKTLWPHPIEATVQPAAGPAEDGGTAAQQ